jgi:dipeptidyl aminopeptidase/acylaminoacyl peptidase
MPLMVRLLAALAVAASAAFSTGRGATPQETKPPLTLDEFFNAVAIEDVELSPDGHAVVIATRRPDWDHNRFRSDLWLYRDEGGGSLLQLTQPGYESKPAWSPDGRWIAFLADRPAAEVEAPKDSGDGANPAENQRTTQLFVIAPSGGEAIQVTHGDEEVHAFAWSADSQALYLATRTPWSKQQRETYEREWKNVIRYREQERGDVISRIELAEVVPGWAGRREAAKRNAAPRTIATSPYRVKELEASPDGRLLAFISEAPSRRQESLEASSIYAIELPNGGVKLLHHGQAFYETIRWSPDSRHLFFSFLNGSVEGPYQDAQPRVYSLDTGVAGSAPVRWGSSFEGAITGFAVTPEGYLLAEGREGTEVHAYVQAEPGAAFTRKEGWAGTYENLSAARHSPRLAFVYSALDRPSEVYLADDADHLQQARAITSFNQLLAQRALPQGKPYRWTADDGMTVEGMLIYPPGKFGATHLPMFTLIHGGPEDADGNHFEADWYQWSALAATAGWLVFEPNYRGSIGYGDQFALGIIPHIVSRPGKDILEGVDALVKEGIADPNALTVGGYSYGGYMTNWLITQTTRFKAAVTGAGAVEHVANWGNDDTSFDDAYFLGGLPWNSQRNYDAEAAIWQMEKVRTPTHIVAGEEDIRVYVGEDYLLERALHTLGVPTSLLIFPGEGHSLDKNPWHGKIKVREELKWLEEYGKAQE